MICLEKDFRLVKVRQREKAIDSLSESAKWLAVEAHIWRNREDNQLKATALWRADMITKPN